MGGSSEKPGAGKADEADAAALLEPGAAWLVTDILRGAPTPGGALPGAIAFKTGTSYGYRDAWAAGYDGEYTIAVWVGRPDATSVPGLVGLRAAAPVLFELFEALGSKRAPFAAAPPNLLMARKNADLPPPLRAFRDKRPDTPSVASADPPVHIAFPPTNSEIELADMAPPGQKPALALKAEGGALPLTWLADGVPLPSSPHRRDTFLEVAGPGFVQVTVIDANGRSDRAQLRLR